MLEIMNGVGIRSAVKNFEGFLIFNINIIKNKKLQDVFYYIVFWNLLISPYLHI